jgi:hypothetical protein
MHIFMDETGSFGGLGEFPSPSLVGALIVPGSRLASLEKKYTKLRARFSLDNKGEVKGRSLDEKQVASVIDLLMEHSALFEAAAIELGAHTQDGLRDFQARQAERMTASLTDEHNDKLKAEVFESRRRFEGLKYPLMVQSMITFELIPTLIEHGTMYYATRRPEELGKFVWMVDAKGDLGAANEWEEWWSLVILPFLQTRWFRKPFKQIPIGDYSHLARFEVDADDWTKEMANWKEGDPKPLDLLAVLKEDFTFSAAASPGLELVDIITNATRRALVGNLQKQGWVRIPELMIHRGGGQYISLHTLQDDPVPNRPYPYLKVLNAYGRNGRVMIPANLKNKKF